MPMPKFSVASPYIIAEVGANHQGSLEKAIEYIKIFAAAGASAVKFQKRQNDHLFSREALMKPYENRNSFGATYGAHRRVLELSETQFAVLKETCRQEKVDFVVTPFDEWSLAFLKELSVDALKVSSFDCGNTPFLRRVRSSDLPVVMSTGGSMLSHIDASVSVFQDLDNNFALLHCVSKYPCPFDALSLNKIPKLINRYPNITIGLSDHFNGILSGPAARLLGASVFEKHVTLDRSLPGSDHSFALEPDGFRRFCRDIRRLDLMLVDHTDDPRIQDEAVFSKLGKYVVTSVAVSKGDVFSEKNLSGMIPGDFEDLIPVRNVDSVLGTLATKDYSPRTFITNSDLLR